MCGGGGGGGTPDTTTNTQIIKPWGEAAKYLKGNEKKGITGVFPAAESFFDQYSALNPQQQGLNTGYFDTLSGRQGNINQAMGLSQGMMGGAYDPRLGFTQARTAGSVTANPYQSNTLGGFQALGKLNPAQALQQQLSGKIDNPYLQQLHQANINTSMRGYNDAVKQVQQNILPGIEDQAFASGGYGGSRQGVAEGLVGQQLAQNARDLGIQAMDTGAQLYGGAYEGAQGRKAQAADMLANMGYGGAQYNADVLNRMGQFNAQQRQQGAQFNVGQMQNADQYNSELDMQQQAARMQNQLQGIGAMQQAFGMGDTTYNQQQALLNAPMSQYQNALNQYANILTPGAGMGSSSTGTSSVPTYDNSTAQMIGGGLSLAGLLSSLR